MDIKKEKYIYTKKPKEKYLKPTNLINSSKIKEIFNSYLVCQKEEELQSIFNQKIYIQIYNYLFLINNTHEYIEIYSFINEILMNLMNKKIKLVDEKIDALQKIINIINYLNKLDKKIKNLKNILTTCISHFNSKLIKSMNDKMSIFTLLTQTKSNNNFLNFIDISENTFLNLLSKQKDQKENQKTTNSIYQFIKIIKIISNKKKNDSFSDKIFEFIIKNGKYNSINEEAFQRFDNINEKNNFQSNLISNYFNLICKEVEKDYIIVKKIFGEKDAIKFKDKIAQIFIFDKLVNQIFKNEQLLKIIISEKKYDILKLIEEKTRHSLKLAREFTNSVFDLILKNYQNKILLPKDKMNIKEGVLFIEKMLYNIKELNNIFKEVFNQNRKALLKFQETLLQLISSKNLETMEYFLSIFVNENIYNNTIRNNLLLDKSFIQLLTNCNNKEIFFNYHKKYIIKRISNNIFNLDTEINFEKFLKKNIENRFLVSVNRLFKDIEETKFINTNNTSLNYFYLFSYDTLDIQYDLLQIIDSKEKLNPFKSQINIYNRLYPKRKITLSQILSTIEIFYLKNYNLLVNYIQWYILQIISEEKNNKYCITYEKLSSLIPCKHENKIFLKVYINSLVEMNILIKETKKEEKNNNDIYLDDLLKINFNYKNKSNNIKCFIKPNNIIKGMIKQMNYFENDKNEKEKEDYNKNYRAMAAIKNIKHIIDCIIMQITKSLPKGENISEKSLIIKTIKHQMIQDLHPTKNKIIDTPLIKERLTYLVESI